MRQRRNVDNLRDLDAHTVDGTDGTLTTITGTLDVCLHLAQTKVESNLCAVLGSHLGSVRRILLATTETHLTCAGPADSLTFGVGEGNDDIVERTVYVELTLCVNLHDSLLAATVFFAIVTYYLVAFFLLATVFLRPLRVRALFLVL